MSSAQQRWIRISKPHQRSPEKGQDAGRILARQDIANGAASLQRFAERAYRGALTLRDGESYINPPPEGDTVTDPLDAYALTDIQKRLWPLRDKPHAKIAAELGISINTVHSNLSRARIKIYGHGSNFIPKAPKPDMAAAAESAGYQRKELWKDRGKQIAIWAKTKSGRNVAIRAQKNNRKEPCFDGLTPARITLEGDATYIIPTPIWREMQAQITISKIIDAISED